MLKATFCGVLAAACASMASGCFLYASPSQQGDDSHPLAAKDFPVENAEAEQLAWDAAPAWAKTVGTPPPTIVHTYVRGAQWLIERNDVTGIPLRRTLQASIDYKGGSTGKCRRALTLLVEENQGGNTWGPAFIQNTGSVIAVTCDSMNGLRASPPR